MKNEVEQNNLNLQKKTKQRFKDLNYWPKSKNNEIACIQEEIKRLSKESIEDIENAVVRAKYLIFDFQNVLDIFENLQTNIKTEWTEINDRISDVIEDIPLMTDGLKLHKKK